MWTQQCGHLSVWRSTVASVAAQHCVLLSISLHACVQWVGTAKLKTGKRDGHDKLRTESHKRMSAEISASFNRWRSATPAHSALQPCRRRTHFAPLFGTQLATPSLSVSKIHIVLSKARALNPDDRCATYYRALHVAQDKAGPFVAVLTALRCL